jgi:hypothetical protein
LIKIESAGGRSPIDSKAATIPTFWLLLISGGFDGCGVDLVLVDEDGADSRGAAIAS